MKTDAELMLEFQAGEQEAFDALLNRHQVGLFNFFLRLQGNVAEAEDLTQEVFVKLFQHVDRYEVKAKFKTYMYRIAKNLWLDSVRKRKRRGTMLSLDKPAADGRNLYGRVTSSDANPLEENVRREEAAKVQAAIERLPEPQRMVFVLAEVQELPYAEISDVLDIPVGTVKSRMHSAVSKLREQLEPMS
jgi:RNA polymerase sigma-70 factor (ECF subfamily)